MIEIEKKQLAKLIKTGKIQNITARPLDTCYALTCNDELILKSSRDGIRRLTLKTFADTLESLGWNRGFYVAAEPMQSVDRPGSIQPNEQVTL
jgi:hypothetical protein